MPMSQAWKTLTRTENLLIIPNVCPMVQNKPNNRDKQTDAHPFRLLALSFGKV